MQKALLSGPYKNGALVPASPWLDKEAPAMPSAALKSSGDYSKINWTHANETDVFRWIIYYQYEGTWSYKILDGKERTFMLATTIPKTGSGTQHLSHVLVSAVDRMGNESDKKEVNLATQIDPVKPMK
jgi:hypothetical protein